MLLTLCSTPSSSSLALSLLVEIYGQYIQNLTVEQGSELSLESVSTLPEVVATLLEAAGKSNDALGVGEVEREQVKSWLTRIGAGEFETEAGRKVLDTDLSTRTFLVGREISAADISLFASVHSYVAQATHTSLLTHPSLTRHFDHIQSLPLVSSALAKSTIFTPALVVIDVDNVPLIEIKADVKPPKKGAAPPVAVEKVKEVVKEESVPAPAAGAAGGVKKVKAEKKAGGDGGKKPVVAPVVEVPAPWMIDLRVGTILDVKRHPDADSLYVETIDVGEPEPRTVVSGLVNYMSIDQLQGRTLITVCNLKPANMRGVKSFAMVLCASSKDGKDGGLEFVDPPAGSKPGDRVYFEGFEKEIALDLLNPKKKIWEGVQPGFTTLDNFEAAWVSEDKKVYRIVTDKGPCKTKSLAGASLS